MDYASFTKNVSNGAIKAGATVELTAGNLKKTAEQEVKTTERGNQKFIKLSRTFKGIKPTSHFDLQIRYLMSIVVIYSPYAED